MFPKRYCATITDYVKANYISGENPIKSMNDMNPTLYLPNSYSVYMIDIKINQKNSAFKLLNISEFTHSNYWRCINLQIFSEDGKNVDLSKTIITNPQSIIETFWADYNKGIETINNLYVKDRYSTDTLITGEIGNKTLKAITNIKVENASFVVSNYASQGFSGLTTLTFKSNCSFRNVLVLAPNVTRQSLINLLNVYQKNFHTSF